MNIEDVNRAADAYLSKATGTAVTRMEFLKGVWAIQNELEQDNSDYRPPHPEIGGDALAAGSHLFQVSAPEVPIVEFRETVARIARYVTSNAGLDPDQASALDAANIATAIDDDAIRLASREPDTFVDSTARALVEGARETNLSPATVTFVLKSALTPFLTAASASAMEALTPESLARWDSGDCPVCGSAAALGRIAEGTALQGAARSLWCSMCHAEWSYPRIRCARCGTRAHDSLRYTHVEHDPAHRLHLCDDCHGYLKSTFEGEIRHSMSMIVEDAATLELDAIARANGYSPEGHPPGTGA